MALTVERFLAAVMAFIISLSSLFGIPTEKKIQNVILMIGDGMGEMHLKMTEEMRDVSLTINEFPQQGKAITRSANKKVTDSAAGATALACGVKTANGQIGTYWLEDPDFKYHANTHPKNITEVCRDNGLKTGVITTDDLSGATPGGFTAHTSSRNNDEDITSQQLKSGFDIIWGKEDGTLTEKQVTSAGYTYIDTIEEMNALTGDEKSYGMFTASLYHTYNKNDYTPTLSQMTEKAIELLDATNENGFFLMVEGAHIDKKSHNKDEEGAAEALEEFDNAVEVALNYAKENKHTLVVVTADHETGGVTLNDEGVYEMTTGDHTNANVPVRAYAPGNYVFIENWDTIDNTEISQRIVKALQLPADSIPCEVLNE